PQRAEQQVTRPCREPCRDGDPDAVRAQRTKRLLRALECGRLSCSNASLVGGLERMVGSLSSLLVVEDLAKHRNLAAAHRRANGASEPGISITVLDLTDCAQRVEEGTFHCAVVANERPGKVDDGKLDHRSTRP